MTSLNCSYYIMDPEWLININFDIKIIEVLKIWQEIMLQIQFVGVFMSHNKSYNKTAN